MVMWTKQKSCGFFELGCGGGVLTIKWFWLATPFPHYCYIWQLSTLNHLQYLQVVVVPVHQSDTSLQSLQANILSYFLLKCDLIVMEFLDLLEAQLLLCDLHLSRSWRYSVKDKMFLAKHSFNFTLSVPPPTNASQWKFFFSEERVKTQTPWNDWVLVSFNNC